MNPFTKMYNWVKSKVVKDTKHEESAVAEPTNINLRGRYLWVSVFLQRNPLYDEFVKLFGKQRTERVFQQHEYVEVRPGMTRKTGANRLKRAADAMGRNNKERRRIRTYFKRAHAEAMAEYGEAKVLT